MSSEKKLPPQEVFKPIPVSSPAENPLLFSVRCWVDLQLKTITDFLRPELAKLSGRVLDIGAGNAPWKSFLPSTVQYTGLDTANAQAFAMRPNEEIVYYQGDTFPFADNQFHHALCVEVLEHVAETPTFLHEIYRCLQPAGTLLLTVPWSARRHHLPYDYFRFTPEALEKLLTASGFVDVRIAERGNDFASTFNKILCLIQGLFFPQPRSKRLLTVPLAVVLLPSALLFFVIAHLSLMLGVGSRLDPLGYALIAKKPL